MVDIETMGTGNNAVITQIGACMFDKETGDIGETFTVNIDIQSCLNKGLVVNGDTIGFWLQQEGRSFLKNPISLDEALSLFYLFCKDKKINAVWAHATFDFPILANAYSACEMRLPFHFRAMKDLRTLVYLSGTLVEVAKVGKTHDALDDCKFQVNYFKEYYKIINAKKCKCK